MCSHFGLAPRFFKVVAVRSGQNNIFGRIGAPPKGVLTNSNWGRLAGHRLSYESARIKKYVYLHLKTNSNAIFNSKLHFCFQFLLPTPVSNDFATRPGGRAWPKFKALLRTCGNNIFR